MVVSFECVNCEADFELEVGQVLRDPSVVKCPNCNNKANTAIVESAFVALDEFLEQIKRLHRRFRISLSLEAEEIASEDDYDEVDDGDSLWENEVEEDEEDEDL